jgi:hypothetical protein
MTTAIAMPVKTERNITEPTMTLTVTRSEVVQLLEMLVISKDENPDSLITRLADMYRAFLR